MDARFELNGATFVWDIDKAEQNPIKHPGVSFEQAAEAFFDPFFRLIDASRNDQTRHALLGYDTAGTLLHVVHVEIDTDAIRIVSARKATREERANYDS